MQLHVSCDPTHLHHLHLSYHIMPWYKSQLLTLYPDLFMGGGEGPRLTGTILERPSKLLDG